MKWRRQTAQIDVPSASEYLDKVSALDHLARALTFIKLLPESGEAQRLLMETYRATCDAMWPLSFYAPEAQGTLTRRAETTGSVGEADSGPVTK